YISEFNAGDYADDQEACLEEIFNHFDQFVECLQTNQNINIDINKLPIGAIYQSVVGKDPSIKKQCPNQKETKKCDCKSRIIVTNTNTPDNLTCTISQAEGNSEYDKGKLFEFVVPICNEIIHKIPVILLDATHGTNKHKYLLYTLLSPDPKTGKGIALAHLISSRKNFESI
ncbi:1418_t:CDS:2, partial [Dentiscutata heterogama]